MRALAERLQAPLQQALGHAYAVTGEPMMSQIGSGALPVDVLPSFGLAVRAGAQAGKPARGNPLGVLERRLRDLPVPVIGRIADDTLWLDLRCLEAPHADEFERQLALLGGAAA
jgi:L-seryl-tRNA(Ser) seleniumtransferase